MAALTRHLIPAVGALALALMLAAPAPAHEGADADRKCFSLQKQWKAAAEKHRDSPQFAEAQRKAESGNQRCNGGAPVFGMALLIEAIELLGERANRFE